MKIILYKPNGDIAETYTAHEAATPYASGLTGPDSLEVSRSFSVESASFFRGEEIEVYDRGNAQTQVSFSCSKTHTDLVNAEDYVLNIGELLQFVGMVEFIAFDLSGKRKVRYMDPAAVTSIQSNHIGVTSFHRLTILGGKMLLKQA